MGADGNHPQQSQAIQPTAAAMGASVAALIANNPENHFPEEALNTQVFADTVRQTPGLKPWCKFREGPSSQRLFHTAGL